MIRRTLLARLAKSNSANPTLRKPHRLRDSLEPLEDRMLLTAVTWTVDQAQSDFVIAIPDQPFALDDGTGTIYSGTLQIRNQSGGNSSPWSVGNSAQISGTIATEYSDGSSLEFLLGQSNLTGVNSGSYIPDPANWNGTDFGGNSTPGPGVFGGRLYPTIDQVFGLPFTVGYFNFTDVNYGLASGSLPITSGSFPANTTDVGISSAVANVKGQSIILVGQILDDAQVSILDLLDTNQAATGTIIAPDPIGQPNLRQMTFPIFQNFSLELSPGTPPFTGTITGQIVATATLPESFTTAITGRHIFYDNSKWDGAGDTAGINSGDTAAIATDKTAYLPGAGSVITPASMSSYSRGLNGIFIDLTGTHGTLSLADFGFKMSNQGSGAAGANNSPSTWSTAPAPTAFTVLSNNPVPGTDRVEFIWADLAITNRYLEVRTFGNDAAGGNNTHTGLAATDIFYFGSKPGDTFVGTGATTFLTSGADEIGIQASPIVSAATITSVFDMDRNGAHTGADRIVARTYTVSALTRINIGSPPAAPAPPAGSDGSAVASALTAPLSDVNSNPSAANWLVGRPDAAVDKPPPAAQSPVLASIRLAQLEAAGDESLTAVDLALDEELLDSLLDEISV